MKREVSPSERRGESSVGAQGAKWSVVKSPLLGGEEIVVLRDPAYAEEAQRAHPGLVIYSPQELRTLRKRSGDADFGTLFRGIHLLKKKFDGVVIPSTRPITATPSARKEDEGEAAAMPERMDDRSDDQRACWWSRTGRGKGQENEGMDG